MDITAMLGFLLGGGITLTAYILAVGIIFPAAVENTRRALELSLWKPFLIGIVNLPFFVIVAALLFNFARDSLSGLLGGMVVLVPLAILGALGVLTSAGLSGLTRWVAGRLTPTPGPLGSDLRAALLLVLACMAPFIGWFVFTPFVLAVSLGAGIQVLFKRRDVPPA